jgi:hypothetical protein
MPMTRPPALRRPTLLPFAPLLLLGPGCSASLPRFLDDLEPGGAIHAKAVAEPVRAAAPVIPRNVAFIRFTDDRDWSDTFHVGAAVADFFAGVFSLGFAAIYDSVHPQHRNQPVSGLEKELPREIAAFCGGANTFAYCSFVDHSLEGLKYLKGDRALSASTDLVVSGSLRAFTGEWDAPEPAADGGRSKGPLKGFRGRIEAVVTVTDARNHAELWSGPVGVVEPLDDVPWSLKDDTECTLRNKLAVAALGAFLRHVDATLREQLPAALPAR